MSGIYDLIRPTGPDTKKLSIWPLYASFWQLMEGDITSQTIIDRFEISGDALTDFNNLVTEVNTRIAAAANPTEERRALFHEFWNILVCIEMGYMDESSARTRLGI